MEFNMGCKTIVPISSKKFIFFKLAEKIPQYKIKLSKISKLKAQGRVCQYLVEETNSPTKQHFKVQQLPSYDSVTLPHGK